MLKIVVDEAAREDLTASLDEIAREGTRRMLAAALEDEVAAYIAAHGERDEQSRRPETGLVFTTRTGQPVEPRNFVRSFRRICDDRKIRLGYR